MRAQQGGNVTGLKTKTCVSCHRDVDGPRRLDFMTDNSNRRWCSMCVVFGMSLVDPDAAWALAGRGPVLEGARSQFVIGGVVMDTKITSEKLCAALGPAWVPRSTTDKVLAKAECAVGDVLIWAVVVPSAYGANGVLLGLQWDRFSDRILEFADADPGPDLGAAARKLLVVARERLVVALRVLDKGLYGAACVLCGGPGPFSRRGEVLEETKGRYERDEACKWCRANVPLADRPVDNWGELMRGPKS